MRKASKAKEHKAIIETYHNVPEKYMEAFYKVFEETLNQTPFGELEISHKITPDSIRNWKADSKRNKYITP